MVPFVGGFSISEEPIEAGVPGTLMTIIIDDGLCLLSVFMTAFSIERWWLSRRNLELRVRSSFVAVGLRNAGCKHSNGFHELGYLVGQRNVVVIEVAVRLQHILIVSNGDLDRLTIRSELQTHWVIGQRLFLLDGLHSRLLLEDAKGVWEAVDGFERVIHDWVEVGGPCGLMLPNNRELK